MIKDFPKLESPFVRENIDGKYVVIDEINPGYEWVFEDESVMAIEKLHGTNVSIVLERGQVGSIYNRKNEINMWGKGNKRFVEGILNALERGYLKEMVNGQHFGELIGPQVNGNPYKLDEHLWIPFNYYARKHLRYKSWGKYPKDFSTIKDWFKELMPLYAMKRGDREGYVEGIVFTHPDGRMAKLRVDMFS